MSDGLGLALATSLPFSLVQSSFSPLDVAGIAGWWDASDLSTITEISGAVSQWDDKSGELNHVVQGVAANQPATGLTTINSMNVLNFAGGNNAVGDWLIKTTFSKPNVEEVFVVFTPESSQPSSTAGLIGNDADQENIRLNGGGPQWRPNNDAVIAGAPGDNNDFGSGDGLWNPRGITGSVIADLTLPFDVPVRLHCTRGNNATQLFNTFVMGGDKVGGGRWIKMQLAEMVVYDVSLAAQDRTDLREYLRVKWGVA